MSDRVSVVITRQDRYRFLVDYGAGMPSSVPDEPPPLGESAGPSPVQLLAGAVANCLSANLVFAYGKFKEDPGRLIATAVREIGRNEKNRLRVNAIDVTMTLGVPAVSLGHRDRVQAQFEEFCTVSQSVRTGIPYTVAVKAPDGRVLKASS